MASGTFSGVRLAKTEIISCILLFFKTVLIHTLSPINIIKVKNKLPKLQRTKKMCGCVKTHMRVQCACSKIFCAFLIFVSFTKSGIFGDSLPFGEILAKSYLDRLHHRHRLRQPRVQDQTSLYPPIHQNLIRQNLIHLQICLHLRSLRRCLLHCQILNLK